MSAPNPKDKDCLTIIRISSEAVDRYNSNKPEPGYEFVPNAFAVALLQACMEFDRKHWHNFLNGNDDVGFRDKILEKYIKAGAVTLRLADDRIIFENVARLKSVKIVYSSLLVKLFDAQCFAMEADAINSFRRDTLGEQLVQDYHDNKEESDLPWDFRICLNTYYITAFPFAVSLDGSWEACMLAHLSDVESEPGDDEEEPASPIEQIESKLKVLDNEVDEETGVLENKRKKIDELRKKRENLEREKVEITKRTEFRNILSAFKSKETSFQALAKLMNSHPNQESVYKALLAAIENKKNETSFGKLPEYSNFQPDGNVLDNNLPGPSTASSKPCQQAASEDASTTSSESPPSFEKAADAHPSTEEQTNYIDDDDEDWFPKN